VELSTARAGDARRGAVRCVSVDPVLSGCVVYMGGVSTRLGGFRALKKTTEAPYTTKVNNRGRTSRGTTPGVSAVSAWRNAGERTLHPPRVIVL
jgi:hypothetical protein